MLWLFAVVVFIFVFAFTAMSQETHSDCLFARGPKYRADVQRVYIVNTYKDSSLDFECARPRMHWVALYGSGIGRQTARGRATDAHSKYI